MTSQMVGVPSGLAGGELGKSKAASRVWAVWERGQERPRPSQNLLKKNYIRGRLRSAFQRAYPGLPRLGSLAREAPSQPPGRLSSSQAGVQSGTATVGGLAPGCLVLRETLLSLLPSPRPAATEPSGPDQDAGPAEKPTHRQNSHPGASIKDRPTQGRACCVRSRPQSPRHN